MALRNTKESYGWLAKLLHWVIALLLVGLVYAGLTFNGMERGPDRTELAALHKSMALLTLLLITVRLVWKFMNTRPVVPTGTPAWQKTAATLTHWLLYAAVYFQLTAGILASGQRPIGFFGLFEIPPFLQENEEQHELFESLHGWGWKILAGLVTLHLLAALYHHIKLKDDVLRRMTTG
jgi:cytochrome b561